MADNSEPISNISKPAKAPTEKKKRKRPSKKVPTTVLQANNSGFMHLVQKLTGSAEELAAGESSSTHLAPSTTYESTATNDVDPNYTHYGNYSSAPYSNAPPYSFQDSFQVQQYPPYQDPAPPTNYHGGSSYDVYGSGSGYGMGGHGTGGYGSGGYGTGPYDSSGYGRSGSGSYGDDNENHTYGYNHNNDNDNNSGSSPSSSRGLDGHDGSPNELGTYYSGSNYYW